MIEALETTIADHNEELSNPEVYDDADRRDELLREVSEAQMKLENAFEEWTEAQHQLEELAE
jgi:ATP-binding cassette subfamily F protein 3